MMGEMVMMTVEGWSEPPSLEQVAEELDVSPDALDPDFGVILVDPQHGIFTVRVESEALSRAGAPGEGIRGPFSDPRIGPFGLPE